MMYSYQKLSPENIPVFCDYLETIRDEFQELEDIIPANREIIEQRFKESYENQSGICIIASEQTTGIPVGVLILSVYQTWWAKEDILTNVLFYVTPKARSGPVSKNLLNIAKAFSVETNKPLYFELLSGPETTWGILERYLAMSGLEKYGSIHLFDPKKNNPANNIQKGAF